MHNKTSFKKSVHHSGIIQENSAFDKNNDDHCCVERTKRFSIILPTSETRYSSQSRSVLNTEDVDATFAWEVQHFVNPCGWRLDEATGKRV